MTKSKLINKLDKLLADFTIKRDGKCVKCGNIHNLTTSHYFNRRYMGTRFHLLNLDTLCIKCHTEVEKNKSKWYKEYKMKQLGNFYEQLVLLKNQENHFKMHDLKELYNSIKNILDNL